MQFGGATKRGLKLVVYGDSCLISKLRDKIPKHVDICVFGYATSLPVEILDWHVESQVTANSIFVALMRRGQIKPQSDTFLISAELALEHAGVASKSIDFSSKIEAVLNELTPFSTLLVEHLSVDCIKLHTPLHTSLESSALVSSPLLKADSSCSVPYFSSLIEPSGKLALSEELLRKLYQTKKTYYCTGGASLGNAIAILAMASTGGGFLVDRGCHQSVHRALRQVDASVKYISAATEVNGYLKPLELRDIRTEIDSGEYRYFIYNACTYDGLVANNRDLIDYCHNSGVIVIADEAWLSHGIFTLELETALDVRADIVIHSPHKMMGALSQGALIHSNLVGSLAIRLEETYKAFTTSSPSYPIIASLEYSVAYYSLLGPALLNKVKRHSLTLAECLTQTRHFEPERLPASHPLSEKTDSFKFNIQLKNSPLTGLEISKVLFERFGICIEKATSSSLTLLLSPNLAQESIEAIGNSFIEVDRNILNVQACLNYDRKATAFGGLAVFDSCGQPTPYIGESAVSVNEVVLYPPGIPLLLAGELISEVAMEKINNALDSEYIAVHGLVEQGSISYLAVAE